MLVRARRATADLFYSKCNVRLSKSLCRKEDLLTIVAKICYLTVFTDSIGKFEGPGNRPVLFSRIMSFIK